MTETVSIVREGRKESVIKQNEKSVEISVKSEKGAANVSATPCAITLTL